MVENIGRYMLKTARQFIIDHKAIFEAAIIAFAKVLPEPTKENTGKVNTHNLIDLWGWFEQHNKEARENLFAGLFKVVIDEFEHDPFEEGRMQACLEKWLELVIEGRWQPRSQTDPSDRFWIHDDTNKGYLFIKECYAKNRGE